MAGSSRTTFAKRQKEKQRQEKQAEKAQRRLQRKAQEQDPNAPEKPKDLTVTYNEEGIPEGFGFHDF
ncbi:MAG TPA: hypothetical protein VGR76_03215 [Candidatus Angelobacter sp.]|jgi:hypothetical protein|nr:hypothetical protein [Candidatus Angelobacter sp.]